MKKFEHDLDEQVELHSGEKGVVIARVEYMEAEPSYLIRYVAADQSLTESWWSGRAIKEKLQASA